MKKFSNAVKYYSYSVDNNAEKDINVAEIHPSQITHAYFVTIIHGYTNGILYLFVRVYNTKASLTPILENTSVFEVTKNNLNLHIKDKGSGGCVVILVDVGSV